MWVVETSAIWPTFSRVLPGSKVKAGCWRFVAEGEQNGGNATPCFGIARE